MQLKKPISDLKSAAAGGRTIGLTQDIALKFYSENPGENKLILHTGDYREIGGGNTGMDKLVYIPVYGEKIFVTLGIDPITKKPWGKQIAPLVSLSRAGGNWTGTIYCIFGEYEHWETGEKIYGEIITQNPDIYNNVPDSNKFVVDTGVYVPNNLWNRPSGFTYSRHRQRLPYRLGNLDRQLTKIYDNANLITKASHAEDLIKALVSQ